MKKIIVLFLSLALLSTPSIAFFADEAASVRLEANALAESIKQKKQERESIAEKTERYRRILIEKKSASVTLEDQVSLINNSLLKTELDLSIAQDEIRALELELQSIKKSKEETENKLENDKIMLGLLARRLYMKQRHETPFSLIFSQKTFAEAMGQAHRFFELQKGVHDVLREIKIKRSMLEREEVTRKEKQQSLQEKKITLSLAQDDLEMQRARKQMLLSETKASEIEYRYLLAELKREQDEADSEISYLERSLRDKMNLAERLGTANTVLSWPVAPKRGLSTRFYDPEYPYRHIFQHPGIDVPTPQGTPVRAAAAGIVARAKDAGMGYSYVMLLHNNNMSTVYGHISRIVVRDDMFVERGDVIGYSGGMPGTPGAGRLTTGPHLHFETRQNGIPVDPMRFLVNL